MVNFYKTIDGKVCEIGNIESGCWVNLVDPTEDEINGIIKRLGVEPGFMYSALDEEETSRIDIEENQTLIMVDVPYAKKEDDAVVYLTIPLGIIVLPDHIITVCLKETTIIKEFSASLVKNVETSLKTRFVLMLLLKVATRFLQYLKQIDKISLYVERQLHKSMRNKELVQLLELEKSLVYFSTSLKGNESTLEKILRGRILKLYEEDQDLLEDVLIEIKQAIEMSNIYSNILSGTMGAFASIISNNLNNVMRILTSITILLSVPTMVASFFGMNVTGIPFPHFLFPVLFSIAVTILGALWLRKKGMI